MFTFCPDNVHFCLGRTEDGELIGLTACSLEAYFNVSSTSYFRRTHVKVKENKGSAGVDSVSFEDYEKDLGNRPYKLWNRRQAESNIKLA